MNDQEFRQRIKEFHDCSDAEVDEYVDHIKGQVDQLAPYLSLDPDVLWELRKENFWAGSGPKKDERSGYTRLGEICSTLLKALASAEEEAGKVSIPRETVHIVVRDVMAAMTELSKDSKGGRRGYQGRVRDLIHEMRERHAND